MRIRNKLSMSLRATTVLCAAIVSAPNALANPDSLVLWNKLGSIAELMNSEIGPDFSTIGSPQFLPGMFDSGFRSSGTLNVIPNPFDSTTPERGAIEFWAGGIDPAGNHILYDYRTTRLHTEMGFWNSLV